ncbi:efflux RND transporter periplasmic adaptor subunit [uncultured Ferrimonas sp.]|uniref:efflux RND transporter periplasmic adaptor subunit n=1 Tax=uncultured Ferrimonas sp. TaxID=432640 RepID=UPI00261F2E2E|nr:efflux RND transporter periplasmic adaptor subunit [uncultured Ferrimonas sp.]
MPKPITPISLFLALLLPLSTAYALELVGVSQLSAPTEVVSRISGVITAAPHQIGDPVQAKQLLVALDATDFALEVAQQQAQLQLAQANLQLKQADYQRYLALANSDNLARTQFDLAKSERAIAQAQLQQAKLQLQQAQLAHRRTQIIASFNGIITVDNVSQGQFVEAGAILYQLADPNRLTLRLLVSEQEVNRLRVGQPLQFWAASAPQHKQQAQISRIGLAPLPQQYAYPIEIDIDNHRAGLKPGMSIHARIAE